MNRQTYLILGANGQLGKQFAKELSAREERVLAPDEKKCDITDFDSLARYIDEVTPTVVINCAAYNAVDLAEQQSDIAMHINGRAVENIAKLSKRNGIFLVHYSTDYVFDGKKGDLYTETDSPNPMNAYGRSKLAGEEAVQKYAGDFLLFRTSWVFGNGTQNFIHKLMQWAEKSSEVKLSSDEVSVPTGTADLASLTLSAHKKGLTGLFHCVNSGFASRYDWGVHVAGILGLKASILPVPMSTFPSAVVRPAFTAMSNDRLQKQLRISIPDWKSAVVRFFEEYPIGR